MYRLASSKCNLDVLFINSQSQHRLPYIAHVGPRASKPSISASSRYASDSIICRASESSTAEEETLTSRMELDPVMEGEYCSRFLDQRIRADCLWEELACHQATSILGKKAAQPLNS